jgi:hypothetical protein
VKFQVVAVTCMNMTDLVRGTSPYHLLLLLLLINKSECVSVCVSVCLCVFICMYFKKKQYILLVSASLLRFLIIATTIETETCLW